jgi:hypothetical protein
VSGHGGNIHHPELAVNDSSHQLLVNVSGKRPSEDKDSLEDLDLEVAALRVEGRFDESRDLKMKMRKKFTDVK